MANTTEELIDRIEDFMDDESGFVDYEAIEDFITEFKKLQACNAELERERDELSHELQAARAFSDRADKPNAKMIHLAQQECDEWKRKKFARFADDECWLFQDDGEDNLHSLVCPVVMSKDKTIELVEAREKLDILSYKIMSRAMNRQDENELDMLMKIIEHPPKTTLTEHDAEVAREALWAFDQELRSIALDNEWDTDSDAYYISQLLRSFADHYPEKIHNGKDGE